MELRSKGIVVDHNTELSLVTFSLTRNGLVDDATFIEKIILLIELIGKLKPRYVLFDKSDVDFEITARLYKFAERNIIGEIIGHGVRLIFFLVNEQRYQLYRGDGKMPPFVIPCRTIQQVYDAITTDQARLNTE